MAATFDPTLATARDRLRLALGDTDVSDATAVLFADETYDALIAAAESEDGALLAAARAAYARLANEPTQFKDGDGAVTWGNRLAAMSSLIDRIVLAEQAEGLFDVAEFALSPFGTREFLRNERLRIPA